jgi:hypothetical protein
VFGTTKLKQLEKVLTMYRPVSREICMDYSGIKLGLRVEAPTRSLYSATSTSAYPDFTDDSYIKISAK